jgi:hypothetical protein
MEADPNQVMHRLGEGSPTQEHVPHMQREMDVAMHPPMPGMPGQPFPFSVPPSHVPPSPHVFDRNGAAQMYKQVTNIGGLGGFNGGNFHHDMSMHQRPKDGGYGSEDDEYGQSPGKRKLDDVMQRQQHSNREKKRRNEMNEAIEALKVLLPQSDKNRFRVTKVSVLNEAIEYIQRIKELCMILAKDKRELHDDNTRLHQQLSSLGKDVGEPRRWDDRNLMETLQSSVQLPSPQNSLRDPPFSPNGRIDYQNEFHGFPPFGMGPPHPGLPPHPGMPFPHMPLMGHPQMRMPAGGPGMPPHMGGLEFNPMAYPFFPSGPGGPGGRLDHNPNFQDFRTFPQGLRDGQGDMDPQFQNQNFNPEHQQLNEGEQGHQEHHEHGEEQIGEHREEHQEQQQQQMQEQHPDQQQQLLQQNSEGGLVVHNGMDVVDNGEHQGENPESENQNS